MIAALYLDGGIKKASPIIEMHFSNELTDEIEFTDYKTQLQEISQQLYKTIPSYRLVRSYGLEHKKTFESDVRIKGKSLGRGEGTTKKESEQRAAKKALLKLREEDQNQSAL